MYIRDIIVLAGVAFIVLTALSMMVVLPMYMVIKIRKFAKEEEQEILNREGAI